MRRTRETTLATVQYSTVQYVLCLCMRKIQIFLKHVKRRFSSSCRLVSVFLKKVKLWYERWRVETLSSTLFLMYFTRSMHWYQFIYGVYSFVNTLVHNVWRNVTSDVNRAYQEVERAEKRMYKWADDEEIETDYSIQEAMNTGGRWRARLPAEFTAEYFKFGNQISHINSVRGNTCLLL